MMRLDIPVRTTFVTRLCICIILFIYITLRRRERELKYNNGAAEILGQTHTQKKEGGREREKENENFVRIDARLHRLWSRGDRRSYTNAAQKSRGVQLSILVTRYIYWGNSSTSLDYKTIQTPLSLSLTQQPTPRTSGSRAIDVER